MCRSLEEADTDRADEVLARYSELAKVLTHDGDATFESIVPWLQSFVRWVLDCVAGGQRHELLTPCSRHSELPLGTLEDHEFESADIEVTRRTLCVVACTLHDCGGARFITGVCVMVVVICQQAIATAAEVHTSALGHAVEFSNEEWVEILESS